MKYLKKLATKKIILLAIGASGLGAFLNPDAIELLVSIGQVMAQ